MVVTDEFGGACFLFTPRAVANGSDKRRRRHLQLLWLLQFSPGLQWPVSLGVVRTSLSVLCERVCERVCVSVCVIVCVCVSVCARGPAGGCSGLWRTLMDWAWTRTMFKNVFGSGFLVRTAHVILTWVITLILFLHDTGKTGSPPSSLFHM